MAGGLKVAQVYGEMGLKMDGFKKGMGTAHSALDRVHRKVLNLRTAIIGLGAGWVFKRLSSSLIDAASNAENLQMQMEVILGSAKEAERSFEWAREFGRTTPFETADVVQAFNYIKMMGIENAEETIKAIGDTAVLYQKKISDVARAMFGMETEVFRNLGVIIDRTGKKWSAEINGKMIETTENTIPALRKAVIELMGETYAGGMEKAKNSYSGAISEMKSMWWELQLAIIGERGSGGPFDYLIERLGEVRTQWNAWVGSEDYKDFIADWRERITGAMDATVDLIKKAITATGPIMDFIGEHGKATGYGLIGLWLFGPVGGAWGATIGQALDDLEKLHTIQGKIDALRTKGTIDHGGFLGADLSFEGLTKTTEQRITALEKEQIMLDKYTQSYGEWADSYRDAYLEVSEAQEQVSETATSVEMPVTFMGDVTSAIKKAAQDFAIYARDMTDQTKQLKKEFGLSGKEAGDALNEALITKAEDVVDDLKDKYGPALRPVMSKVFEGLAEKSGGAFYRKLKSYMDKAMGMVKEETATLEEQLQQKLTEAAKSKGTGPQEWQQTAVISEDEETKIVQISNGIAYIGVELEKVSQKAENLPGFDKMTQAVDSLETKLGGLKAPAESAGKSIGNGLYQGIMSGVNRAIAEAKEKIKSLPSPSGGGTGGGSVSQEMASEL